MTECAGCNGRLRDADNNGTLKSGVNAGDGLAWFDNMMTHCLEYARRQHEAGRTIVGILCEYTPRELILAAGGVPVCLCGGSTKTIPAAEEDLPANLCPLIKSTYGYSVLGSNPFLEMASLIIAETTCDGKKKMYERMAETRPLCVLELPQKPDRREGLAQWEKELRGLCTRLERHCGTKVTDSRLREAIAAMNRERSLRRELATMMAAQHPPLTGRELLRLKSSISGTAELEHQLACALAEARNRTNAATGRDRVRVLMSGVPMVEGAEWVLELVEQHGGLVVALENCTGLKPILEDVDEKAPDPIRALAEKYYHLPCSIMTANDARLDVLRQLTRDFRPQCVIELIWQACLTYDVESWRVRRLAERELGLPYLRIETGYTPSDAPRLAVRVEALFESVRDRLRP